MDRHYAEFRATINGNRLTGHAAVFNQEARIRDFTEVVAPGAFHRALAEGQDVVLLANHDGLPLARTTSKTLHLDVDKRGLYIEADLPDTTLGRDVRELTRRGDLASMSFGFTVVKDAWTEHRDGGQLRTVEDVDLFDVSVVTFPAYSGTDLALRGANTTPRTNARDQAAHIRAKLRKERYDRG